ncbi:mannose-specific lectin-like [Phalaenopsis equestris]|uniref:mannose-specific lectin-like n=1 Tax=Phalaenopsis equestris TaxID=78828 RepID=UPI0009E1B3EB|nr:mannose-specific lectin-like [Phalaenopsis equestris]
MSSPATTFLLLLLSMAALAIPASANDRLKSGQTLYPGESLQYGVFSLTMQTDCNLVLRATSSEIWYTGRVAANCILQLQFDGNLVISSDFGARVVWSSNSIQQNKGVYELVLQSDRNVVIYGEDGKAIWASNTSMGGHSAMAAV